MTPYEIAKRQRILDIIRKNDRKVDVRHRALYPENTNKGCIISRV